MCRIQIFMRFYFIYIICVYDFISNNVFFTKYSDVANIWWKRIILQPLSLRVVFLYPITLEVTALKKINERQHKFAEYYAQCGNTVQSAIKAGYSENYANKLAHKLLENVGVIAFLWIYWCRYDWVWIP